MLIVSRSEYLGLMMMMHPESTAFPDWQRERKRRRERWMKDEMRAGNWRWSRGPVGKLP